MRNPIHSFGLATLGMLVLQTAAFAVSEGSDNFANAPLIGGIFSVESPTNTDSFTTEPGEPAHSRLTGNSAWWRWVAPANGYCTLQTLQNYKITDTGIAVYTGNTVNALTRVTAGDDSAGSPAAKVTFYATAGTTYRIAVDSSPTGLSTPEVNLKMSFYAPRPRRIVGNWSSPAQNTTANANGTLSLSVTQSGAVTGTLTKGTTRYRFKSFLTPEGYMNACFAQPPSAVNPLGVPLALDVFMVTVGSPAESIYVTDGVNVQGAGRAEECPTFTASAPFSNAGVFNLSLRYANSCGTGYAIAKITPTGNVRMTGMGGDGQAFSIGNTLASFSLFHAYQAFQKGNGFIQGVISFNAGNINAFLDYRRGPTLNSAFYPAGFTSKITAAGIRYVKPVPGKRALDFLNATMGAGKLTTLDAPGELGSLTENLTFTSQNKFVFANATRKPVLKINPATGLVTGSIVAPATTPRMIRGILSADNGVVSVRGFVSGNTRTAAFTVVP